MDTSSCLDSALELRWKGTFLEVVDKECTEPVSPRAFSDPGSQSESERIYFEAEKVYAACLPNRMSHSWGSDEAWTSPSVQTCGDEQVNFFHCAKKKLCVAEDSSDQEVTTCDDGASQTQESSSVSEASSSRKHCLSAFLEMDTFPNEHEKMLQFGHHLKFCMQNNAVERHRTLRTKRLSNALESIKEIPEQVAEVLEEATTKALDLIQNEVSVAQNMIFGSEPRTNRTNIEAVERVSAISDMISTSLDSMVANAVCKLQVKVDDMVEHFPSFDEQDDEIVRQMLTIPEEVGKITRAAVEEASCSSQVHVVRQLDEVLNISASEHIQQAVSKAQKDLIAQAQDAVDIQIDNATSIVKLNEQTAVTVNGDLADSLLRAKAAVTVQDGHVPHSLTSANPGTKGHPEFCSRPCIYFPLGSCVNGSNCGFCHARHPKREPRLDKINRVILKSMDAPKRCNLILSIVVPKLIELEIFNQDIDNVIKMLAHETAIHYQPMQRIQESRWKALQKALKTMMVQSLLGLIRAPEDSALDRLVRMLSNLLSRESS